jgi:hypothetical protein
MGNFTAAEFGCAGTDPFCEDPFLPQRTGSWAVDILGVGSASDITNSGGDGTAAPEPSSMLLLCTGFTSLALLRRRGKQA